MEEEEFPLQLGIGGQHLQDTNGRLLLQTDGTSQLPRRARQSLLDHQHHALSCPARPIYFAEHPKQPIATNSLASPKKLSTDLSATRSALALQHSKPPCSPARLAKNSHRQIWPSESAIPRDREGKRDGQHVLLDPCIASHSAKPSVVSTFLESEEVVVSFLKVTWTDR